MSDIHQLQQIDLGSGQITKMRWSPDGRFLAVPTQSGSIAIFDNENQDVAQTLERHTGWVTAVAWDLTGFLLTGSRDRSVALWDLKSGTRTPFSLKGHKTSVHSIDWTDENAFAMTCSFDHVRALDGYCLQAGWTAEMEEGANKRNGFTAAACSNKTTFLLSLAADGGNLLTLVSLLTAKTLGTLRMTQTVRSLVWSSVDDVLAIGTDKTILLLNANQEGFVGRPRQLAGNAAHVHALAFSADGRLLASRDDNDLKFWDVQSGKLLATLHEEVKTSSKRPYPGIAFHPEKPLLATVASQETAFRILDVSKVV